jgi:triacylglycerol lipase
MTRTTPYERLDPRVAKFADAIPFDHVTADVLASLRVAFEPEAPEAVVRTVHEVPGEPPVPLRAYRPRDADGVLPCIYSMHGGGYVLGTASMNDAEFDALCPRVDAVAVSVEYRLAPETPYPGPLEDAYRGLCWVHDHARDLGIEAERIGVMGISAGGGLAAALALLARDRGGPPLAFQLLDSPMIDDRQITPSSREDGLPVWSRESNAFGWRSYLGALHGRNDVPYTAAPARAQDLSGLPPAFVAVGAVDGFRDEDVDYALRLNQAGVPTELHVYPGACHGFHLAADAPVTKQHVRNTEEWLIRQLHPA